MEEQGVSISTLDDFLDSWTDEDDIWTWMLYFTGVCACLIAGVLMVIGMLVTAFVLPCCRCCGNCGGKYDKADGKHSRRDRIGCGITVFIFMGIMAWGAACIFIESGHIKEQLSGNVSIFDEISYSVCEFEEYLGDSVLELNQSTYEDYDRSKDELFDELYDMPETVIEAFDNATGVQTAFDDLVTFTEDLPSLNALLSSTESMTEVLKQGSETLATNVTIAKADALSILEACTSESCDEVKADLNDLTVTNYTGLISLQDAIDATQAAIGADIEGKIKEFMGELNKIRDEVNASLIDELNAAKETADEIGDEILDGMNELDETLGDLDFAVVEDAMEDVKEVITENYIDDYVQYGLIGIGSVICLIIVCTLLGLLHGSACPRPKEDESCTSCSRAQGARWLLAAVAFNLIFYWLLMLFVIAMYGVGDTMTGEFCRHVINYNDSDSGEVLDLFDNIANDSLYDSLEGELLPFELYRSCSGNLSIYRALDLANRGYNITELLDISQIEEELEKIKGTEINLPNVTLTDDELQNALESLDDGIHLDYDSMLGLLEEDVTQPKGLDEIAEALDDLSFDNLTEVIQTFRNLSGQADDLEELKDNLHENVTDIKSSTGSVNLTALSAILVSSENFINTKGDELVSDFVNTTLDNVLVDINGLVGRIDKNVSDEVGRCAPVYFSATDAFDAACVKTVYPVNAIWFTLGWCTFFLFISLIMSLKLVTLYRKTEPYQEDGLLSPGTFSGGGAAYPEGGVPLDADTHVLLEPAADYDKPFAHKYTSGGMNEIDNPVFDGDAGTRYTPLAVTGASAYKPTSFHADPPPDYEDIPAVTTAAPPEGKKKEIQMVVPANYIQMKYNLPTKPSQSQEPQPDYW